MSRGVRVGSTLGQISAWTMFFLVVTAEGVVLWLSNLKVLTRRNRCVKLP